METTNQKIKNIFQEKFKTPAPSFEVTDFDAIQLQVARKKFYSFKAKSFNIYYAVAITFTFLGTLALGTDYLLTKKKIESQIETLNGKMKQWNTIAKYQNNSQEILPITNTKVKQVEVKLASSAIARKSLKEAKLPNSAKKSLSAPNDGRIKLPKDTSSSVAVKPIDLKPKTVYIIKQDTIIRYDSVKVKRRK